MNPRPILGPKQGFKVQQRKMWGKCLKFFFSCNNHNATMCGMTSIMQGTSDSVYYM